MADMKEIGPTFYFAPPRVFEQMLTRVMIRMEDAGAHQAAAVPLFPRRSRAATARRFSTASRVPLAGRLLYGLGELLVYGPLKNVLGLSRVRVAYTAGEAIGPDLFSFFRSIGLNLKQLYGQTEAFLYLTAQPDGEIYVRHGRACRCRTSTCASPRTARCCSSRRACSWAISRTTPRPPRP